MSVDLPRVIELRRRLLPSSPRQELVASSVIDGAWLDEIDGKRGALATAQGLLMYLQPEQVHELIAACANRIADGALLFDAVPAGSASALSASRWAGPAVPAAALDVGPRRRRDPPDPRDTPHRRAANRCACRAGAGLSSDGPCRSSPTCPDSTTDSSRSCWPASRRIAGLTFPVDWLPSSGGWQQWQGRA